MAYRSLAVAVAAVHLGYLAYLLVGGFLAWRWPRTLLLHLLAAGWGAYIVVTASPCPLTLLQNLLRARAGQPPLEPGFVDVYVTGVVYPGDHEVTARVLLAVVVASSWGGLAVRRSLVAKPAGAVRSVVDRRAARS
jgi:hypothetical protein